MTKQEFQTNNINKVPAKWEKKFNNLKNDIKNSIKSIFEEHFEDYESVRQSIFFSKMEIEAEIQKIFQEDLKTALLEKRKETLKEIDNYIINERDTTIEYLLMVIKEIALLENEITPFKSKEKNQEIKKNIRKLINDFLYIKNNLLKKNGILDPHMKRKARNKIKNMEIYTSDYYTQPK